MSKLQYQWFIVNTKHKQPLEVRDTAGITDQSR